MRIAIVSSPRCGNTWVRSVLSSTLSLPEIGVHNYLDVTSELPQNCALQVHWYREPNFQRFLREHGFRVVVIARHPLDLLISVLHFVRHEPLTSEWLLGNAEIPTQLAGQSPTSDIFMDYALSWGAENLLSISYQWWHDSSVIRVKYEDLVASPAAKFEGLVQQLSGDGGLLGEAIARFDIDHFRSTPNKHGWQGQPGLWRQLLPFKRAREIYVRHRRVFETLDYEVPFSWLTTAAAAANWQRLVK
jgi:hypothetical protein